MNNYRSGLEAKTADYLEKENVPFLYESEKLAYIIEAQYNPDFILPNGIYLEIKGFLTPTDRRKMRAVKAAHPDKDIRFVFQRNNKLNSKSKTTYGQWADKNGFPWCVFPSIPPDWLV